MTELVQAFILSWKMGVMSLMLLEARLSHVLGMGILKSFKLSRTKRTNYVVRDAHICYGFLLAYGL